MTDLNGDTPSPDLADLVRDLDDDDVGVRLGAVRRGLEVRPPGLVRAIRDRIATETDGAVRTAFVVALVRLGEDVLLREVARALRHKDPVVVAGAARVLGEVGDARAVPNLIEAFKTEDVVVGAVVARALGQLGDLVVVPWLLAALEQGFCPEACALALGSLGDARALPVLQALSTSTAADPRLRLAAAQAVHALQERG
ncbi:MAG: HEAT repeat domain-containing protein [Deltaproteobacteria bacterium]|nr:HEAT repeat domain-containing protein [Deltaproteobacteria bacterium]